jgi:hypothetical protein
MLGLCSRSTLALGVLSTGCSFVLRGPPARPISVEQPVKCETPAAPVLDMIVAVPALTAGAVMVAQNAGQTCEDAPCGPKMAVGFGAALIALGIVYGVSSTQGFRKLRECREVVESQLGCREGNVAACLKLQPETAPASPSQ